MNPLTGMCDGVSNLNDNYLKINFYNLNFILKYLKIVNPRWDQNEFERCSELKGTVGVISNLESGMTDSQQNLNLIYDAKDVVFFYLENVFDSAARNA